MTEWNKSMSFDLSNWKNGVPIYLEGEGCGREAWDQKLSFEYVKFEIPIRQVKGSLGYMCLEFRKRSINVHLGIIST